MIETSEDTVAAGSSREPAAIVALGASAGGLEALMSLFSVLPNDTGAAFIVLQHLARDTESLTPELLDGRSSMPVRFARDGIALEPDHVYCLPPGSTLRLREDRLELREDGLRGASSGVIDAFLRSLAADHAPRMLGVILSGAGSDGTLGLGAIREQGGITFAQDPAEAEFGGMPRSAIRAGVVDYVRSISDLAELLVRHLRDASLPVTDGPEADERQDRSMAEVLRMLSAHTGHDFELYKPGTIRRRLQRRARLSDHRTLEEYVEALREDKEEADALFHDVLIGVTEFFRDPEVWEELARNVLPDLVERVAAAGRPFRAWVPGCSTGEEVYTLLILLEEEFERQGTRNEMTLFATDIDERALGFAREGLYPEGIAAHVSKERLERFFVREDDHYLIDKRLRDRVVFAVHNVLQDAPFSRQDVICCRNLLIYLQPEAQRRAISVFQYSLHPEGILLIGASEHLGFHPELFGVLDQGRRIFRRNEIPADAPVAVIGQGSPRRRPVIVASRGRRRRHAGDLRSGIERSVLHDYGPACVLVDAQHDVLQFFGRTSDYLEPSDARGGSNLLDMAPPTMRSALRSALTSAAVQGREVRETGLRTRESGAELVDIVVRPARELGPDNDLLLVVLRPAPGRPAPGETPPGELDDEGARALRDVEEELKSTRLRLQASIEELRGYNEELRSSNEELLSMNEELQTAKEEILSVNEELKTVNAEVKTKIQALNRAHSDLQNLFRSTAMATVFLNRRLEIQRFTPAATDLFRLRESDVGRPIADIVRRFDVEEDLLDNIERVLESLEPIRTEVYAPGEDRWFTLRIFPYRTIEDVIEGAVLTFSDVTELKQIEHRLLLHQEYAESIVTCIHEPVVVMDDELRLLAASPSFWVEFGFDEEESRGKSLRHLRGATWDITELRRFARESDADEVGFEVVLDDADGERAQYEARAKRIGMGFGEESRILVYLRDVTVERQREQLREDEVRRKDWFLAMLGHEIRNPLAPIRNAIDLLKEDRGDAAYHARMLDIIERQLDQLTRLVSDVLDVSRITGGRLSLRTSEVDVVRLVEQVVEDHRQSVEAKGLALGLRSPEEALLVEADADRLTQALSNLLVNARKYTSSGGAVDAEVERIGSDVVVAVTDTGIGMTRELTRQVFEPFQKGPRGRDAEQGLGIGLTLVRAIIEEHGGSIEATSSGPGCGSRFAFRLPLVARHGGSADEPASTRSADAAFRAVSSDGDEEIRVLLVEDMEAAAETLTLLLEAVGCQVSVASTGEEAVAAVWSWKPSVVLCDLGLPGSMTGFDVARAIRGDSQGGGIRIVAVTGYSGEADRKAAADAGFDAYLVKPVAREDLMESLGPRR